MTDQQALSTEEKAAKMDAAVLVLVADTQSHALRRVLDFSEAYDELSALSRATLYDIIMAASEADRVRRGVIA